MANTIEQKILNGHGLRELVRKLNRGFVKKTELSSYVQKGDTYSKFEINNIFTKKIDMPSMPDMSNYALKSDIPKSVDMSNYVSKNGLEDLIKKIIKDEDTIKPPDIPKIHEDPDQPLPPDVHIPDIKSNTTPDFITDLNHNVIREYNLDKAEKLVFPATIKQLDSHCFSDCKNITDITLLGIKKIPSYCFSAQKTIQKIFAPICLEIEAEVFYGCLALEEVLCPEVLKIGTGAFESCSFLKNISLPKCQLLNSSDISSSFGNCVSLKEASFPELLKVDQNLFKGCTAIEKVYMPKIKYIDKNLFWDTPKNLKELVVSEECNIKTIVKNDLLVASPCVIYNSDKSKIYNKKEYKWEPAH